MRILTTTTTTLLASVFVPSSSVPANSSPYSHFCDTTNSVAITQVVPATEDATLFEGQDNISAGRINALVGRTSNGVRRALFRFDLSDIRLPSDARVVCAEISLYAEVIQTTQVSVHTVTSPWGTTSDNKLIGLDGRSASTGDATWVYAKYQSAKWDQSGGDFEPMPWAGSVGSSGVDSPTGRQWFGANIASASQVQQWIDGSPNYGIALLGPETDGAEEAYNMYGGVGSGPTYVPKLIFTYTSPSQYYPHLNDGYSVGSSRNYGDGNNNIYVIVGIVMCSLLGVIALIGGIHEGTFI
eukprot:CAMPEP_0172497014 /NCGR_PEP_ID=MMETSP1066-20121228/94749_1 /TAXON_ID=671091 /ORGANISM="Coscinodiscus wailesii, Strain CCMP2513" /LENGTH=297 /DNA_ID=CAMNT_0013269587 /DNA_START=90 /DNA_END=980 /DNA_ORIENTATION=-